METLPDMTTLTPDEQAKALQIAFRDYVLGATTHAIMQGLQQGKTVAEIARQFGVTRQAVEYRAKAGRKRVSEFLSKMQEYAQV
jgi:hypothetical protein